MNKTNNSVDFSFILPCYNVEKYVEDCIKSITSQNFDDITYEILCIDDKSSDKTLSILENLAKENPFIKIHKNIKNRGVSYSRNVGINNAIGKWILFLDSDDLMMPNVIKQIHKAAEENDADAVALKALRVEEDFKLNQVKNIDVNSGEIFANCAISAAYNLKKLKEYNLFFNENISYGEDTLFRGLFFYKSNVKIVSDILWYLIRKNGASLTQTKSKEKLKKIYFDSIIIYEEYIANNLTKEVVNHAKEGIALKLAQTMDRDFIKQQLPILKSKKYYPYKFRKNTLLCSPNILIGLIQFLCPIEPCLWLYYKFYKTVRGKSYK